MTFPVHCPKCQDVLDVPSDFSGQSVRCGNCGTVFTAPADVPVVERRPQTQQRLEPDRERLPRRRPEFDHDDSHRQPEKKSNLAVWLIMLVLLVTGTAITFAFVRFFTNSMDPQINPYTSAEGRYEINFPHDGRPLKTTNENNGKKVAIVESSRQVNEEHYTVKYFDLPAKKQDADPQEVLTEAVKAEVGNTNGMNQLGPRTTLHQGYPAQDLFLDGGPFSPTKVLVRAILVDSRVYLLIVRGNIRPEFPWIQQYFLSFKITKPKPADKPARP